MASIKDVANLAGVGLGTASRALSGKGYVAPETRKRIEEAARKLSYRPNVLAQNLLKNRDKDQPLQILAVGLETLM